MCIFKKSWLIKVSFFCLNLNFSYTYAKDYGLVFASNSISSPASAYGHVALVEISDLDDSIFKYKAYNFSAVTDQKDRANSLKYLYKGLNGSYKGSLEQVSFHKLFRRYKDYENRSVYILYLDLDEREKELFSNLISSERSKEKPYFFLNYNCATDLYGLLFKVSVFKKKAPNILSPPELVRRVFKAGKFKKSLLLSPLKRELVKSFNTFTKKRKKQIKKFIFKYNAEKAKQQKLSSKEIQFVKHFISMPRIFLSKTKDFDEKYEWLVNEEKKQKSESLIKFHKPKVFEFGRDIAAVNLSNRRLGVGVYGHKHREAGENKEYFLNYSHTVLDRQRILGLQEGRSWLELASLEGSFKDDKLTLKDFEVFNYGNFQNYNSLFLPVSTEASMRFRDDFSLLQADFSGGVMTGGQVLTVFFMPGLAYQANLKTAESSLSMPLKLGVEYNSRVMRFNFESFYSYNFKEENFHYFMKSFFAYKFNNYLNLLIEVSSDLKQKSFTKEDFEFKAGLVFIDF